MKNMKKITGILFAFAMLLTITFVSNAISENNPLSAKAQTGSGQVRVTKRKNGIGSRTVRGTRYVYHKAKRGTIYAGKKTYQGGKYVGKKTVQGTKYAAHKTKRGTKSVISRTKKILQ